MLRGEGSGVDGARGSKRGPGASNTRLIVCDLLGQEVAVLVNERKAAGSYEVQFDASKGCQAVRTSTV